MKKIIALLLFTFLTSNAQDKDSVVDKKKQFLKQHSESSCKCIDSISTYDISKKEIADKIGKCIDKSVFAYQISKKLSDVNLSNIKEGKPKEIKMNLDFNKDSEEYQNNYYEIERDLMENCKSIKSKIAVNDKQTKRSMSKNEKALAYYNLGLEEKTDPKKAIEYYKKAVEADPKFAFAYDNMGINYRRIDDYDNAIKSYEKSLDIDDEGLMPLQNIAVVYEYKKEYQKAIKAYQKLGKVDSKNPEVFYRTGRVYMLLEDNENALTNLCKAYNLYIEMKSPYRTDAENVISLIYSKMKKEGKDTRFKEILAENKINMN